MTEEVSRFQGACPVHGHPALDTCERCGSFVCARCEAEDAVPGEPVRCEACREKVGAGVVPWESGSASMPVRWARTTWALLARPTGTLERTRPTRLAPALGYAAVTGVALALTSMVVAVPVYVLVGASRAVEEPVTFAVAMVCASGLLVVLYAAFEAIGALVRGLVFFGGLRAMGASDARLSDALWTAGYLSAVHTLTIPVQVLTLIPFVGPLLALLGMLAMEVLTAIHLVTAARAHHGLSGGRAAFAGWLSFFLLAFGGCVLCFGLALLRY